MAEVPKRSCVNNETDVEMTVIVLLMRSSVIL